MQQSNYVAKLHSSPASGCTKSDLPKIPLLRIVWISEILLYSMQSQFSNQTRIDDGKTMYSLVSLNLHATPKTPPQLRLLPLPLAYCRACRTFHYCSYLFTFAIRNMKMLSFCVRIFVLLLPLYTTFHSRSSSLSAILYSFVVWVLRDSAIFIRS